MEPRKQFLCRLVATRPEMVVLATPEEDRIVGRHFAYLKSLTERGTVLIVGRTQNPDPTAFGIHILLASSEAEARGLVDGDPAVREGIMRAELYPYKIALLARPEHFPSPG
jgi:uncharacterized protein YciI